MDSVREAIEENAGLEIAASRHILALLSDGTVSATRENRFASWGAQERSSSVPAGRSGALGRSVALQRNKLLWKGQRSSSPRPPES